MLLRYRRDLRRSQQRRQLVEQLLVGEAVQRDRLAPTDSHAQAAAFAQRRVHLGHRLAGTAFDQLDSVGRADLNARITGRATTLLSCVVQVETRYATLYPRQYWPRPRAFCNSGKKMRRCGPSL